MAEVQ